MKFPNENYDQSKEMKSFILSNAITAKGQIKKNFFDENPTILDELKKNLSFIDDEYKTSLRNHDYLKAYIFDIHDGSSVIDYICGMYEYGRSVKEINDITNYGRELIRAVLLQNGLIKSKKPKNKILEIDYQNICSLYESGLSMEKVAEKYNVSHIAIKSVLLKMNVDTSKDKKTDGKENEIISLYNEGKTCSEIARSLSLNEWNVSSFLKSNGYELKNHLVNDNIIQQAIDDYTKGDSAVVIAKRYNISSSIIYRTMKKMDIERRSSTDYSTSIFEYMIKEILDEYSIEYVQNDRKLLGGKELDFYIPSYNLAIECNGVYWHSEEKKGKTSHYDKFKECEKLGVQLLQFYSHDFIEKFDIVKSIVLNKVGKTANKVYARNCTVKEVAKIDEKMFLKENHIQGYSHSKFAIGLYHNDELLMVMTLGTPRFDSNSDYEIIRVATKLGYNVVGGFSKLLKSFVHGDVEIISYCNLHYGNGKTYLNNGFEFLGHTGLDYFYSNNRETVSRYKVQNENFRESLSWNSELSEKANMLMNGYQCVYGVGNYKFKLQT